MGFDAPFNHEFFIQAEAGVVPPSDPGFTTLKAKMNMDHLRREPEYYLCATNKYAMGLYSNTWKWSYDCTHWLSQGEEIYILSFWANRQKHVVSKERWHKVCWEALQAPILEMGAKLKQQADDQKAREDFELAQYRLANPIKRGKKSIQDVYGLTDDQALERKKILAQISTYNQRLSKYLIIISNELDSPIRQRAGNNVIKVRSRITKLEVKLCNGLGGTPGTKPPEKFVAAYDAITQSITHNPDYYDALEKEHYYEGGDIDHNDANDDTQS